MSLDSGQQCHPVINVSTSKQGPQLGQTRRSSRRLRSISDSGQIKGDYVTARLAGRQSPPKWGCRCCKLLSNYVAAGGWHASRTCVSRLRATPRSPTPWAWLALRRLPAQRSRGEYGLRAVEWRASAGTTRYASRRSAVGLPSVSTTDRRSPKNR